MKRNLLFILAVVVLFSFVVCGTAAAEDTKPYEGTEIRVFCSDLPDIVDPLYDMIPEFEEKTGIKVTVDTVPESDGTMKKELLLSSESSEYDVYLTASNDLPGDVQAGWYTPIDDLLGDYDYSDFSDTLINLLRIDGKLYALPIRAETNVLMYRSDVFDELGITVPATLNEYEEDAAKMTRDTNGDGKIDFYGTAVRGAEGEAAYTFTYFLKAFGGHFMDTEGHAALASAEAIAALEYYVGLNEKYAPADAIIYTWDQVFAGVQNGTVGMIIESSLQCGTLEDPNKSTVVGKMGYAVAPGGQPDLKTYGYNISSYSDKKEAAAEFVKWAVSEEVQKYAFEKYGFAGVTSLTVLDECSDEAPYFAAIADAMAIGNIYYLPLIPECGSIYTATGEAVAATQAGTPAADAMTAANAKVETILEDAGYFDGTTEVPQFVKDGLG